LEIFILYVRGQPKHDQYARGVSITMSWEHPYVKLQEALEITLYLTKRSRVQFDLDKKCKWCHEAGAGPGGYCLNCIAKMFKPGELEVLKKAKANG